jgi:hypothetical protein
MAARTSLRAPSGPRPVYAPPKTSARRQTKAREPSPDLIIVAGISGSGKSTFLKQLKSGRLPRRLVLPADVKGWPVVGSSQPIGPRGPEGVILHYDMNGRDLWNGADYHDDPALVLVGQARTIIVINLRPPLERLISQLTERESAKLEAQKRERSRLIWRLTAPAVRLALRILPPRIAKRVRQRTPFRYSEERLIKKLRVYKQPGWLDDLYARWGAYLDSVAQSGKQVRQIFLAPGVKSFCWRLTPTPTDRPSAARRSPHCRLTSALGEPSTAQDPSTA